MINGEGKLPPRIPTAAPPYKPRALEPVKLRKMDHAQWLKNFSETLAINSRVEMTPFRMGAITRLAWASAYIDLLQADVLRLEGANELLTTQIREHQTVDEAFDNPHHGHRDDEGR